MKAQSKEQTRMAKPTWAHEVLVQNVRWPVSAGVVPRDLSLNATL